MRFTPVHALAGAVALVTAFAVTAPALAASFNCAKASTADEKAICSSAALSELDVKMATLFGVRMQIPMLMGARGAARDEQVAWLAQRGQCGASKSCLTQAYQQRINALNQIIADAMQDYCTRMGICG
jgi:uncharacterized protein